MANALARASAYTATGRSPELRVGLRALQERSEAMRNRHGLRSNKCGGLGALRSGRCAQAQYARFCEVPA